MAQKRKILKEGDKFERYTIVRKLGEGGMGAVYQVYHAALDSTFALKILSPEAAEKDSEFVDRFVREARLSSHLRHPNLIAVHDAGRDIQNGMYYLVMDYVDGGSVRDKLDKEGRLTPEKSIAVVLQVLSALTEARKNKMVHRDIKPDNIMFTSAGVVKLADLGIAKATNDSEETLTMEATIFGTPAYMSPQQAHDAKNVDCRADIYSLGIVFYEMLTGQCPYRGAPMAIIAQVVGKDEVRDIRAVNPAIPDEIANIVMKMCAKNLEDRYQTPEEVLEDMGQLLDPDTPLESFFAGIEQKERSKTTVNGNSSIVTSRETWENEWRRRRKYKKILLIAGCLLAAAGLVGGTVSFFSHLAEKRDQEEAERIALAQAEAVRKAEQIAEENAEAEQRIKELEAKLAEESSAHAAGELDMKKIEADKKLGIKFSADNKMLVRVPSDYPHREYAVPNGITGIAPDAFAGPGNIEKVIIPESIRKIGRRAFAFCYSLQSIELPNTVASIDDFAFSNAGKLEHVVLPESLMKIGTGAFTKCAALKKLVIPPSVVSVASNAVTDCPELTEVRLSIASTLMGQNFQNCGNLKDVLLGTEVRVPVEKFQLVPAFSQLPFSRIATLEKPAEKPEKQQTVPEVKQTAARTPQEDPRTRFIRAVLREDIDMVRELAPQMNVNMTFNGKNALFYACEKRNYELAKLLLEHNADPNKKGRFGSYGEIPPIDLLTVCMPRQTGERESGWLDRRLKMLTLLLEHKADTNCSERNNRQYTLLHKIYSMYSNYEKSSKDVSVPDIIRCAKIVGPYTKFNDRNLRVWLDRDMIRFLRTNNISVGTDLSQPIFSENRKSLVYFPVDYPAATYAVPFGVTRIEQGAFYGNHTLYHLILPESLESTGTGAFSKCSKLQMIRMPRKMDRLEPYTFADCPQLKHVDIPQEIEALEEQLFAGCSTLKMVRLPSSLVSIEQGAFRYCIALSAIDLPSSLKTIESEAFAGCSSLRSVTLPADVEVEEHAFDSHTKTHSAGNKNVPGETAKSSSSFSKKAVQKNIRKVVLRVKTEMPCTLHVYEDRVVLYDGNPKRMSVNGARWADFRKPYPLNGIMNLSRVRVTGENERRVRNGRFIYYKTLFTWAYGEDYIKVRCLGDREDDNFKVDLKVR